eukprot:403349418
MRSSIILTFALLALLGATSAFQDPTPAPPAKCGDKCGSSSDCAKAGDCRLCLSGTCQHRCAAAENWASCLVGDQPDKKKCGEDCNSSPDCDKGCGLCLMDSSKGSRTCQHRCLAEENFAACSVNTVEEKVVVEVKPKCNSSFDCLVKKVKSFFHK